MTQVKIKDLKRSAIALSQSLGLTKGLDMRRKDAWVSLIRRLESLRFGVVVPHLLAA